MNGLALRRTVSRLDRQVGESASRGARTPASRFTTRRLADSPILLLVLLAFTLIVTPASAQTRPTTNVESQAVARTRPVASESEDKSLNWPRLTMAMVVVLGLIVALKYAAAWLFPGARVGASGRGVRVLARTAIAPRQQVLLLHVGRRVLVVGDSAGTMSALANIDEPDEVAELLGQTSQTTTASASSRFKAMFGRAEREYDPSPETFTAADDTSAEPPPDANLAAAQNEISGLLERMKTLSNSVKK